METENLTNTAVHGHVGTDPELTVTSNGTSRLSFRLGIPRRVETADGTWMNTDPHYVTVAMYGKSAERTAEAIHKGDQVLALGHLREYEVTDPQRGPRVLSEFRASRVGHDLNLTRVQVQRRTARAGHQSAQQATEQGQQHRQPRTGQQQPQPAASTSPAQDVPGGYGDVPPAASGAAAVWTRAAHRAGVPPPAPPARPAPRLGI